MNIRRATEAEGAWANRLAQVRHGVEELRRAALAAESEFDGEIKRATPSMRESAVNLVHYLAVRRHDVRPLQDELARLGLSSLGRMEAMLWSPFKRSCECYTPC